jgi:pSer/pThr/pTyr-binding forkhead associated (FHA) protein
MKLSLVVLTSGRMQGKSIPISLAQFLIGRDPECHLRPTSQLISKRHCAILVNEDKAFVRDFESTNGTLVNDEPVKSERQLRNQDRLKVGPLEFRVELEAAPPSKQPTASPDDETAAAMLLSVQDDSTSPPSQANVDSEGVPTGTTIMEVLGPQTPTPPPGVEKPPVDKAEAARQSAGNTSSAAKAILEKYMRRPRR